ncbi:isovaleryl-CoA dehydrogenase [Mycolicibacterium insubricum]|jgi:alkylation response protein AidB-like acyl-CoA dehydrogenase|uniref:Acyl-CoA dehydrogenase n=1 Tax=Mycolicibacterium insubricum TaxID=444597 RepID=A0A1X0CNL1_9MYCO|nr:acyl-CoA dehydrogenase family protein [Mycolicibacterium insubricum]MCB9439495.1 acyl-CoA dehydrogenase family protein [Mycolicibacterium sp.]MCV7082660.1 acyl-CoA dehydrogenase family protein [Mycolicibacterium insubricum]ORA61492.1 acyl-CoA dehydrogenase [Mycolicibacterium insubricum]BBZ65214.1 isovaleryl-CoA dehydrogenase [Mycolicibacterium insubricum]
MNLTGDEQQMVELVADFVDRRVRPGVRDFEADDIYPEEFIEEMKALGFFGLLVPAEFGGVDVSTACFALVTEQLARGWMSLAGAIGGHSVISYLIRTFGTAEQQRRYLPGMADGSIRATMALTEPGGGSDLQAMRTGAVRDGDHWVIDGSKTWISNAAHAQLFGLLCITDRGACPAHRGMSVILAEPGDGLIVSKKLPKLGYRGVEACEVVFDGYRVAGADILGGVPNAGWGQMMRGLEVGRIQVAARALGVGQAALDDAVRYAQQRESFGKPIWRHQSVGNLLADMATKQQAARLLTLNAAEKLDAGERADMEAGMAKLFASEAAMQIALDAIRVHGGYGYSKEYDVERYFRDAPLMIVGEGTNEIQRNVIAAQLIARNKI